MTHNYRLNKMYESTIKDDVNNPQHYKGDIECIDVIIQQFGVDGAIHFCQGNAMKYIFRCEHKKDAVEDMRKAVWYLNKAVELKELYERKE